MTVSSALLQTVQIEALLGCGLPRALRLRRKGTLFNWDVSAASSILMNVAKVGDEEGAMAPIPLLSSAPGADWAHGRIVFNLTPVDVPARWGTYNFAIIAIFNGVPVPVCRGNIEVIDMPVTGPIPTPGGAYYNSSNLELGTNASLDTAIPQGTPVCRTPAGLVPATAASGGVLAADGIALASIPPQTPGLFMLAGSFGLPDWTTLAGTTTLAISTPYYLDQVSGHITTVYPTRPDSALVQLIGESEDGTTLDLKLGQYSVDI